MVYKGASTDRMTRVMALVTCRLSEGSEQSRLTRMPAARAAQSPSATPTKDSVVRLGFLTRGTCGLPQVSCQALVAPLQSKGPVLGL
jgi:hypothetical protein